MPKLGPATRMRAPAKRSSLSTKDRSSRHAANRPCPKPVRSTRLSQSAGMIWSVSTSERSSGTAVPLTMRTGSIRGPRGWRRCRRWRWPRRPRARRGGCGRRGPGGPRSCGCWWTRERSPGASLSGFMARHIEQPGSRQSKPAARKTSCRPSASAWCFTANEPGTTSVRTPSATRRPSATAAAARRSSMRLLVHEPMNTVSTPMSRIGVPAVRPMYSSARAADSALARVGERVGVGHRARRSARPGRVRAPRDVRARSPRRRARPPCRRWRRRRWAASPVVDARVPGVALRARGSGPRGRRRWCRRARSARPWRRPRSTCCTRSCGPPSRAPRMAEPRYSIDVSRCRRRCRCDR